VCDVCEASRSVDEALRAGVTQQEHTQRSEMEASVSRVAVVAGGSNCQKGVLLLLQAIVASYGRDRLGVAAGRR
jgi:hypothetical protein